MYNRWVRWVVLRTISADAAQFYPQNVHWKRTWKDSVAGGRPNKKPQRDLNDYVKIIHGLLNLALSEAKRRRILLNHFFFVFKEIGSPLSHERSWFVLSFENLICPETEKLAAFFATARRVRSFGKQCIRTLQSLWAALGGKIKGGTSQYKASNF